MASFCLIYGQFLAKKFENGNIFGNIDFSLQNDNFLAMYTGFIVFLQFIFFPYF